MLARWELMAATLQPAAFPEPSTGKRKDVHIHRALISRSVRAVIIANLRRLRLFGLLRLGGGVKVPTAADSHQAEPEALDAPVSITGVAGSRSI
jgi:hypothetical protein